MHTSGTWNWYKIKGLIHLLRWILIGYRETKKQLKELIKLQRPDIVHLNGLSLLIYSKFLNSQGVKVVQHIREPLNYGVFGFRRNLLIKYSKKFTNKLISISKVNSKPFSSSSKKIAILYNPVQLSLPSEKKIIFLKKSLNILNQEFIIFFPGGSVLYEKGVFVFIKSLGILKEKKPNLKFKFLIPGIFKKVNKRDKLGKKINKLIDDENLELNIIRVPFINTVEDYYSISNVVVAPFIVPHFSRAVIESSVLGKPVIASNLKIMTEVIEDKRNGYLISPNNPIELAEKLEYLMKNPFLAKEMGLYGFKLAEKYNPKIYANKMCEIYDEIISN